MSEPLILLASPDDYLLELERQDFVSAWAAAHPDGETVTLDPAPPPLQLVRELVNRSLFSPTRLIVVPDASPYFKTRGEEAPWGDTLAGALEPLSLADTNVLLAAALDQEPKSALAKVARSRGELRFLSTPAAPKPWEDVTVSLAQRALLGKVVARVAPAVAAHGEVVDALCEAYGFKVRELAQAAERLALAGDVTPEAVRAQAGVAETSIQRLEDALIARDRAAVAALLGRLSAGGVLVDWRGDAIDAGGVGAVLTGMLNRVLRLALAMRLHAQRCELGKELDPSRCAANFWYPGTFKKRLYEVLTRDAEQTPDSPIAGMSAWPAQRAFRLAAAYEEGELIEALSRLGRCGVERAPARDAVPALAPILLALTTPRISKKTSRAR